MVLTDIEIDDPATGIHVGRLTPAIESDVDRAVARARRASTDWGRTPAAERGAAVHERETGRPRAEAIGAGVSTLEQHAELGPVGFGHGPELLDELTATKVVHLTASGGAG